MILLYVLTEHMTDVNPEEFQLNSNKKCGPFPVSMTSDKTIIGRLRSMINDVIANNSDPKAAWHTFITSDQMFISAQQKQNDRFRNALTSWFGIYRRLLYKADSFGKYTSFTGIKFKSYTVKKSARKFKSKGTAKSQLIEIDQELTDAISSPEFLKEVCDDPDYKPKKPRKIVVINTNQSKRVKVKIPKMANVVNEQVEDRVTQQQQVEDRVTYQQQQHNQSPIQSIPRVMPPPVLPPPVSPGVLPGNVQIANVLPAVVLPAVVYHQPVAPPVPVSLPQLTHIGKFQKFDPEDSVHSSQLASLEARRQYKEQLQRQIATNDRLLQIQAQLQQLQPENQIIQHAHLSTTLDHIGLFQEFGISAVDDNDEYEPELLPPEPSELKINLQVSPMEIVNQREQYMSECNETEDNKKTPSDVIIKDMCLVSTETAYYHKVVSHQIRKHRARASMMKDPEYLEQKRQRLDTYAKQQATMHRILLKTEHATVLSERCDTYDKAFNVVKDTVSSEDIWWEPQSPITHDE